MREQLQRQEELPDRLIPIEERPRLDPPPRVFAASELDYRAGRLHGRWLGLARDPVQVLADLDLMLARSPVAEERGVIATGWLTLASEGFGDVEVNEQLGLTRLTRLARSIRREQLAFAAWARLDEGNEAHHLRFADAYLGHYDSVHDYVVVQLEAGQHERHLEAAVPAGLRPYVEINVAALVEDLQTSGELRAIDCDEGGLFLFSMARLEGQPDLFRERCEIVKDTYSNKAGGI